MWFQRRDTHDCVPRVNKKGIPNKVCTGLFYVLASNRTRAIMHQSMGHLLRGETYDGTDQGAIFQALKTNTDIFDVLSCDTYLTGNTAFLTPRSEESSSSEKALPVVLHANWMEKSQQKLQCMRAAGVWYEDEGAFANYKPDPSCAS